MSRQDSDDQLEETTRVLASLCCFVPGTDRKEPGRPEALKRPFKEELSMAAAFRSLKENLTLNATVAAAPEGSSSLKALFVASACCWDSCSPPPPRAHLRAHGWWCRPCLSWGTPGRLARLGPLGSAPPVPPPACFVLASPLRLLRGKASRPKPGNVQAHLQELRCGRRLQGRLTCNGRSAS